MDYQARLVSAAAAITLSDDSGTTLARIDFPALESGTAVNITRTFVDPSLRGEGVADQLMQAVCQQMQAAGKQIQPTCSYAVSWFEQHPEYAGLLV
jgi:predicted GNAT family acetyltransferase